jgi:tetratricopeptide (TPR) repeat protein
MTVLHSGYFIAGLAAAMLAAPGSTASTQTHKHYQESTQTSEASPTGRLAPLLEGLGHHRFPVTTRSQEAQTYINQGLILAYGFNHAEAGRSFREAARLDPDCAMAYWGQALVLGPNINAAMDPENEAKAHALAQKAVALEAKASPRERALIDALARRYSGRAADREAGDRAYAEAMRAVAQRHPDDPDIAMLYVESMMDLRPWSYWMPDGTPYAGTRDIVDLTESVLGKHPRHPLALHLYIHLMESYAPEKAEAAADQLRGLVPGAGHLVHMPSHIYQRVGRYADSAQVNQAAGAADERYITQCRAQGLYPMAYYPHTIHFLWFAASADGRGELAISAARKTASKVSDEALAENPFLGGFRVVPYYALTRFGKWDEMLDEPKPAADVYVTGTWQYARGLALIAKGRLEEAERALAEVRRIAGDDGLDYTMFSTNSAARIFAIAPEVLAGELSAARKDYDAAIAHLARAVRLEEALVYTEPSEWHFPPRLALGAVLLEAGRPREAATVYWQNLRRHPENGWALRGLVQALEAQGNTEEAALVRRRFENAWQRADLQVDTSRMMPRVASR